ncbi:hypothetical protein LCGC14_1082800 [marine sediment metagenome]|uniref:F5/8 type C domain-containing protein n=1 Tax=marine sediment metagenome TaxID=412755 RepID=A0A0F9PXY3_9ZZZZ
MAENEELETKVADLETLVAQALEIASHHAPAHGDEGHDPFTHSDVKGHSHHQAITFLAGAVLTWTNMLAALTEAFGLTTVHRLKFDLSGFHQARIIVNVQAAGHSTPALIRGQYSTDESSWAYLDGSAGPSVDISATGTKVSGWVDLVAASQDDVFLRIVGLDGDGIVDPQFGLIAIEVR